MAGVFLAALEEDDVETAYGLLCEDERAATEPDEVADRYLVSDGGDIVSVAETEVGGTPAREVRWMGRRHAERPDRRQRGRPVRLWDRAGSLTAGRNQVTCVTRPRARAGRLPPRRSTSHHRWDV